MTTGKIPSGHADVATILSLQKNLKLAIYGTGKAGEIFYDTVKSNRPDLIITCFIDSFTAGTKNGIPVLLPKDALGADTIDLIVICSYRYQEIAFLLRYLGIDNYIIYLEYLKESDGEQVDDDINLLDRMTASYDRADSIYKPTNYWATYGKAFLPELYTYGLDGFRSRKGSLLESFGAADLQVPIDPHFSNYEQLIGYFYRLTRKKFIAHGLDIDKCHATKVGSPEGVRFAGKFWTLTQLQYCSKFADAVEHMPFHDGMLYVELGSGLGRTAEIMKRLYPHATFILADIPPQLYVAHQYLLKVFGQDVLPFDESIDLSLDANFMEKIQGKIVLIPSWKLKDLIGLKISFFWNSASFQEMEPDIVYHFLDIIKTMHPDSIYIEALPQGNYWGKWEPGKGGTKAPVTEDYYIDTLSDMYNLDATYCSDIFLRNMDYTSYIFNKIKGS